MLKKDRIFIWGLVTAMFAIHSVWDTYRERSIMLCILSFMLFLHALLDYYNVISKRLLRLFSSSVGIIFGVIFIIYGPAIETNKTWMIFWISMGIFAILLGLRELRHPPITKRESGE